MKISIPGVIGLIASGVAVHCFYTHDVIWGVINAGAAALMAFCVYVEWRLS